MSTRRIPARRPSLPGAPPPAAASELSAVDRIRSLRVRPARDLSLASDMDRELRELNKQRRANGGCANAWNAVIPAELAERTALQGLSRGVLTIAVPDASTRFTLDRFLRSGGERALIGASSAAIRKVRIVLGGC